MQRIALLLLPVSLIAWPLLADAALKGVVLGIIVALAAVLLRSRSASVRHAVWLAGMGGLLLLPLAASVMPQWRILPEWYGWEFESQEEPLAGDATESFTLIDSAILQPGEETTIASEFIDEESVTISEPRIEFQPLDEVAEPVSRQSQFPLSEVIEGEPTSVLKSQWIEPETIAEMTRGAAEPDFSESSLAIWLVGVWLIGLAWMLLRLVVGQVSLRRVFRNAERLDSDEWQQRIASLCEELEMPQRRAVSVWQLSTRVIPMAWGVFRPRVLLPSDSNEWNDDRLRAVLLHELAHIRRRDCLTQWLAEVARVLHWFNPLSWLAVARMRVERERACDDLVLSLGLAPTAYADQLVKMTAEYPSFRHQLPLTVAMARPSGLEQRVRRILDATLDRRRLSRIGLTALVAVLGSLLLPLAMLDRSLESGETAVADNGENEEANKGEATDAKPQQNAKLVYEVTPKVREIDLDGRVFCEARLVNEGDEPVTVYYGDYAHPLMYKFDIVHEASKTRIPATRLWPRHRLPPFGSKRYFKTIQPGEWVTYTIAFGPGPGSNAQRLYFRRPGRYVFTPTFTVDTTFSFDRKTGAIQELKDAWTGTVEGLPFAITVKGDEDVLNEGSELKGKVVSHDGKPVANALVQVQQRKPSINSFRGFYEDVADQAFSDKNGRFHFRRLPGESSHFRLMAVVEDRPVPTVNIVNNGKKQLPETTLTIGKSHTLRGRVVDWKGKPLQFVRVMQHWTDENGRFEVTGMPKMDEYSFSLYRPGFLDQSKTIGFDDATRGDLQISMMTEAAAEIAGQAKFADGSPLVLQKIRFKLKLLNPKTERDKYERGVEAETDGQGRFKVIMPDRRAYSAKIEALEPNDHNIGRVWKLDLDRMSGGMGPLNLTFENRRKIRVEIAKSNKLPDSLTLYARCLQRRGRMVQDRKISVDTKQVVFERLGPDEYSIEVGVEKSGELVWRNSVKLLPKPTGKPGDPVPVKITIPELHFSTVTARFLLPDGRTPYANQRIWIDASGSWGGVTTDVDGRIMAETVPAGRIWLTPRPGRGPNQKIAELGFSSIVKKDELTDLGTFTVKRIADEYGEVKGTLKYDDGTPVIGAQVTSGSVINREKIVLGGRKLVGFHGPQVDKDGGFHMRMRKGWQDLTFNLGGAAGWPDPESKAKQQNDQFMSVFGTSFDNMSVRVEIKPGEVAQRDIVLRRGKTHKVRMRWKIPQQRSLHIIAHVVQPGLRLHRQVHYDPSKNEVLIEDVPDGKCTVRLYAWDLGYYAATSVAFGEPEAAVEFDPADSAAVAVRVFGPDDKPIKGLGLMVSNALGGQFIPGVNILPVDNASGERHKPAYGAFREREDGTMILGGLGRSRYQMTITGPGWKIEQHLDLKKSQGAAFDFKVDEKGNPTLKKVRPDINELLRDLKGKSVSLKTRAIRYLSQAGEEAAPVLDEVVAELENPVWTTVLIPTTGTMGGSIGAHAESSLRQLDKAAVPALIKGLRHPSAKVRAKCAELVGYTGDNRAIPALIKTLDDAELAVRNPSSTALGRMGDGAVQPLLKVLNEGSVNARLAASIAAGKLKGQELTAALIRQLDEEDLKLKQYAAYAIGQRDNSGFADELIARLDGPDRKIRQQISNALMRLGNDADGALRKALSHPRADVRLGAANALFVAWQRKPDAKTVTPLLKAMNDEDARIRRMATNVIHGYFQTIDDSDTIFNALSARLTDHDAQVRRTAADSFSYYAYRWPKDKRAVPLLLAALEQEERQNLQSFISALGSQKDPRAVEPLIKLAGTGGEVAVWSARALATIGDRRALPVIRKDAFARHEDMIVRALGEMQDREAIPGLIGLLSNPKLQVRVSAAHALEQMPDESAVEPLMKNVEEWWSWTEQQFATQAFLSALVATRDKRVPDLLVRLTKAHRISFATSPTGSFIVPQEQGKPDRIGNQIGSSPLGSALVSFGPRALPAIEKGLASEHAATREVCAWAVHQMNFFRHLPTELFSNTIPILLARLDDSSIGVRRFSARALGTLEVRAAVPRLALLYRNPLPKSPTKPVPNQIGGTDKPADSEWDDDFVRRDALIALGQIGGPKAVEILEQGLKNESSIVYLGAINGLSYVKGDGVNRVLLDALQHRSPKVRQNAIRTLGWRRHAEAFEPILQQLNAPRQTAAIQQAAVRALGRIGDVRAIPHLKSLLASNNQVTRQRAAISLELLGDSSGLSVFEEFIAHEDRKVRTAFHSLMSSAVSWTDGFRFRNPDLLALIRQHAASNPVVYERAQLMRALAGSRDEETRAFFLKAARDVDRSIRLSGIAALEGIDAEAYRAEFIQALDDEYHHVRGKAIDVIAQMERDEDAELLRKMLADPHEDVRGQTIESIARRANTAQTLTLLRGIRDEPSLKLRARAAELIGLLDQS